MKSTIIKFGIYSVILGLIIFGITLILFKDFSYSAQQVLGYVSIFIALSLVFFGIRHFRDQKNDGKVSFGQGLKMGLGIAVFAALGVAIMDYLYTAYINPDFVAEYEAYYLAKLKAELPAEEYAAESAKYKEQMATMGTSGGLALFMFGIVFVIGIIVSIISSLILQRK